MKRIIDGVSYDTETATEIASGDHDHELSQAWWKLYSTSGGAFFEVVAGHDGVVEEFKRLTNEQARLFLERNANHLVEEYFGSTPEARPVRFSRRTVIAAIEVVEGVYKSAAKVTRCFLKWGSDLAARCDAGSLGDRFNHLIKFYDDDPVRRTDDGELLQDAIINEAISLLPSYDWGLLQHHSEPQAAFRRALDLDGFAVREGALIQALPSELELPQAEDDVTRLLKKHGFATSKGHLDQALTAHARGDWASANSQIRSFYESLFDEIAVKIEPAAAALPSSENRRAKLASLNFIQVGLNEWGNDGKNFVNGLFKRLHAQGSHPGLSDQEDSTFRRHTVLLTAKLFLVRLDSWPGVT